MSDEANAERTSTLEVLVRTNLVLLHRRAYRMTRDYDTAQDLVQDTLERAYRKLEQFQPGTDMPAWLTSIMRNVWISQCRRKTANLPTVPLEEAPEMSRDRLPGYAQAASEVEACVVDELSTASIHRAIDGLPAHLRQVVMLADVEETPYWAIAKALAIPPGTVASRLSRGRRRLQQVLLQWAPREEILARAG